MRVTVMMALWPSQGDQWYSSFLTTPSGTAAASC